MEMFIIFKMFNRIIADVRIQDYPSIGAAYLNITPIVLVCNTLLVRAKWSISPAHCVVIRTHPELAYILMNWMIDYGQDEICLLSFYTYVTTLSRQFNVNLFRLQHRKRPVVFENSSS